MAKIVVNALGDACPIPVVKTKKALAAMTEPGEVEVLVDNEIAVQNVSKMAEQKGIPVTSAKLEEDKYQILLQAGAQAVAQEEVTEDALAQIACLPTAKGPKVVAIGSDRMGEGSEELGHILMKAFIFALTQQDELPDTLLFYNGGAKLTSEGSAVLEDLKALAEQGVEILTCGTCINHYGIADKLAIGGVTNMYVIAEKMLQAGVVVKP